MRAIRPIVGTALAIGAVAGLLVVFVLSGMRDGVTLTPAELEQAKWDHLRADQAAWQAAIAAGEPWSGGTEYVPPEPSWPVAHPWLIGFIAADVVTLLAWLILLRSVFAVRTDIDRLTVKPTLFVVPDPSD